jgi:DNA-binding response OmpR family regulator
MTQTILVVDDEKHIIQLVKLYLSNEGYQVETAADGRDALDKIRVVRPDLIVLDLMLPGVGGLEICRQVRQESDVPIIMLTARDESEDRVAGLELGADDYVTKPFNPRELAARVKAVLRRTTGMGAGQRPLEVGNVRVDPDRHEVTIGDRRVELRPKEFELLTVLARRPGVVLPRERLRQLVWGPDFYGDPRTVDVHITWLRDKLSGATARIQTVWGVGYKLVESDGTDDPLEGGRRARRERASAENS